MACLSSLPDLQHQPELDIRVIPNKRLYVSEPDPRWFGNGPNKKNDPSWSNGNWLKSRFHFSFAEYSNYGNRSFGKLRVMNDDLVQPHRGFGQHGHSDMEIVTYVVHGGLYHRDSMGTEETLDRGSVQFMTAGTGIRHEEYNHEDKPLRFIQSWIVPRQRGLRPNYGSSCGNHGMTKKNFLRHIVSDVAKKEISTPVEINQDIDGYVAELELGKSVRLELPPKRMAYLLCIEGGIRINFKHELNKYDSCEIMPNGDVGGNINIKATSVEESETGKVAHVLVFSMPAEKGAGRSDF